MKFIKKLKQVLRLIYILISYDNSVITLYKLKDVVKNNSDFQFHIMYFDKSKRIEYIIQYDSTTNKYNVEYEGIIGVYDDLDFTKEVHIINIFKM